MKNTNGGTEKLLVKTPTVALSEEHQLGIRKHIIVANGSMKLDQEYLRDK